ncbi:MAG: FKBP-type peptidyl-prolyl cis-trans isomerase [Acidimicrobiales bacterium]
MRRLALLLLLPLIFAASCGGGPAAGTSTTSPPATVAGPLPGVSGSYGQAPKITFPAGRAPSSLMKSVLHQGSGPVVQKRDLLVADYLGQIWRGKVFDSSYARKQPAAFPIGVGQVIPGWDKTLVGAKTGSRILLVVPPADGYGPKGDSQAGIKGTDTLVFVVDVIGVFTGKAAGDPRAAPQAVPAGVAEVSGAAGSAPTLSVPKGIPQPTKERVVLLDKGSGPPVRAGLVVFQYVVADWSGKVVQSSWQQGTPVSASVGNPSQPNALDQLIGVPVGSRVLLELPKTSSSVAYAIALDIVAQPHEPGAA